MYVLKTAIVYFEIIILEIEIGILRENALELYLNIKLVK